LGSVSSSSHQQWRHPRLRHQHREAIAPQHYAFLVSAEEFDGCFERIQAASVTYYPEPNLSRPGEINHNDGGRGLYFLDPAGHGMEIITRPYDSGTG